jgi:hypothetical protein
VLRSLRAELTTGSLEYIDEGNDVELCEPVSFAGDSLLKLNPVTRWSAAATSFEFEVTPAALTGVVASWWASEEEFALLLLKEGAVEFHGAVAGISVVAVLSASQAGLKVAEPTTIAVSVTGGAVKLVVNEMAAAASLSEADAGRVLRLLRGAVFVGSLPPFVFRGTSELPMAAQQGFDGCMARFLVDGKDAVAHYGITTGLGLDACQA